MIRAGARSITMPKFMGCHTKQPIENFRANCEYWRNLRLEPRGSAACGSTEWTCSPTGESTAPGAITDFRGFSRFTERFPRNPRKSQNFAPRTEKPHGHFCPAANFTDKLRFLKRSQ